MRTVGIRMRKCSILILAAALLGSGCVYYNTFFLAKKNFKEAESDRKKKGLEIVRSPGKYQTAIEKASRILEYNPDSKYVDDALYLIGRSFYHQGEFSKAETKFRELLATYPESKFADEALFYLGKARYWKEDYVGAREAFERVDSVAKDQELRSESLFMLGEMLYTQEEWDLAISAFSEYLDLYRKGAKSGQAKFKIATAYYLEEEYGSAKAAYIEVEDSRADDTLKYQARFRAGDCFYLMEQADSGLAIFRKLADDEKNYDKMASIYLEIAKGEGLLGNNDAAMEVYNKIIEEFPRTEESAIAFYYLGTIYQDALFDLETAKAMYDSSTVVRSNSPVGKQAMARSADIAKLETYRSGKSAEKVEEAVESQYLLAELYLVQLNQPDSALREYNTLIDSFPDSKYAPRALLAKGWIMENLRGDTAAAREDYRRVIEKYPSSDYVVDAMEKLGIDPSTTDYDYPARRYHEAERLLFTEGEYRAANELFRSIVDDFPESEYAPRASLAIAWSLSNFHPIPGPEYPDSGDVVVDSTYILAYQQVTKLYGGTEYGKQAQTVLAGQRATKQPKVESVQEVIQDTLSAPGEPRDSAAILDSMMAAIEEEIRTLERAPENPTEEKEFERPMIAYSVPIEEQLVVQFKVRINFIGEVTEYQVLRSCGYEEIDRAAAEVVKESVFDATRIEPQFYDSWFYYEYFVPRRDE